MAERVDRLVEHDATRMQYHGAVTNPFSLVEVVSGEDDTAASIDQLGDDRANRLSTIKVDSCSGLIEEDDVGSGSQRKGKRETLALSP